MCPLNPHISKEKEIPFPTKNRSNVVISGHQLSEDAFKTSMDGFIIQHLTISVYNFCTLNVSNGQQSGLYCDMDNYVSPHYLYLSSNKTKFFNMPCTSCAFAFSEYAVEKYFLDHGSILVYGSMDTAVQCLQSFSNPDGCPVLCLKHSASFLFAGLTNGKVAVYHRQAGGE